MSASASAFGRSASCSSKEAVTYSPFCSFRALTRSTSSISRWRASSTRNGLPSLLACSFTTVSFQPILVQDPRRRQIPRWVAADIRRRGGELERDHPPAGRRVERTRELLHYGRQRRGARPGDYGVSSEVCDRRLPAGARRSLCLDLQEGNPRQGSALVREERHGLGPVQVRRIPARPVDQGRSQPRLLSPRAALSRRVH